MFGLNNGVRRRAVVRVNSGHYDVTTWKTTTVKLLSTGETVTLLSIICTPSMKNEVYAVYLAFSGGKFLLQPSRCDCPNGKLFCSHMLGQLLLLYLMQRNANWNIDALKLALPQPVKSVQGLPIAMQYAYGSKEKEAQTESDMCGELYGGHSVDDVEEEEVDEEEEDEVVVEEEDEEEEGVEEEKVEEEEEEEHSVVVEEEGEEDEDERIEELAREESDGPFELDICEVMDKFSFNAERLAAEMSGNQVTGRKHDISGIHSFNHKLVYGMMTAADQRRRDEVHERIAFLVEHDEIRPNMMCTFVLEDSIRERRHIALAQNDKSNWLSDSYMMAQYKSTVGNIEGGANARFIHDEEKKKRKKFQKSAKSIKRARHRNPGSGKLRKHRSKTVSSESVPFPTLDTLPSDTID